MRSKMNRTFFIVFLGGFILLVSHLLAFPQEFLKLPKPTHYVKDVPQVNLKVIKNLPTEIGDKEDSVIAQPDQITANKNGFIYVYDKKGMRIFMFNNKYEYYGQFLNKGQGPGEVFPSRGNVNLIHTGVDNHLYVFDYYGDKIIQFSETGKLINQTNTKRIKKSLSPIFPIIDKDGFFYVYSIHGGIIDKLNSHLETVHTYLKMELNDKFVVYRPPMENYNPFQIKKIKDNAPKNNWLLPGPINTIYDITANGLLLIFLDGSASIYLFKGNTLVQQFDTLIDTLLPKYQQFAKTTVNERKKKHSTEYCNFRFSMFISCFVDNDEPYFYLQPHYQLEPLDLYQFDLHGKLVRILKKPYWQILLKTKRNGLFYGFARDPEGEPFPIILKMENNK